MGIVAVTVLAVAVAIAIILILKRIRKTGMPMIPVMSFLVRHLYQSEATMDMKLMTGLIQVKIISILRILSTSLIL